MKMYAPEKSLHTEMGNARAVTKEPKNVHRLDTTYTENMIYYYQRVKQDRESRCRGNIRG